MDWNFEDEENRARAEIEQAGDLRQWESLRVKYLGKKGLIQQIYATLATVSNDQKPVIGKKANLIRGRVTAWLDEKKSALEQKDKTGRKKDVDVTLPGVSPSPGGHRHLITSVTDDICSLFESLGFSVQDGPEMETEFNNFTALNIPEDHPSRDGFDTFYLDKPDPREKDVSMLLRSHTSPGQIRIMRDVQPPLAVLIPGKVYRPDAVDASHSFMFHQIEGLLVDEDINFAQLKGLLRHFCRNFFGDNIKMRFRPHYFPFTEPSAEVDIWWDRGGRGRWLEIMGCGMVHPNVFQAVGYPKGRYRGLAFGMGVERIAMLKHGIHDIRVFFENDQRFLEQF